MNNFLIETKVIFFDCSNQSADDKAYCSPVEKSVRVVPDIRYPDIRIAVRQNDSGLVF